MSCAAALGQKQELEKLDPHSALVLGHRWHPGLALDLLYACYGGGAAAKEALYFGQECLAAERDAMIVAQPPCSG